MYKDNIIHRVSKSLFHHRILMWKTNCKFHKYDAASNDNKYWKCVLFIGECAYYYYNINCLHSLILFLVCYTSIKI